MAPKSDYLYERNGTWWVRLQGSGKDVRKSLRTKNRLEAQVLASEMVAAHKIKLLYLQMEREGRVAHDVQKLPPGLGFTDAGERYFATADKIFFLGPEGQTVREQANKTRKKWLWTTSERRQVATWFNDGKETEPKPKTAREDDAILDTWVAHRGINAYLQKEARDTMALFRTIVGNKPLKDCERSDGRSLAAALLEKGNKRATIQKKISHLSAAVNIAISDGKLKFNPFIGVIPDVKDQEDRLFFSEGQIATLMGRLDTIRPEDQLLFQLLMRTGMRLSEPFGITEEHEEDGIRYVIVGTKTDQSRRRVPLPLAMLPLLPARITGPLFGSDPKATGKRLMRFIRDSGIEDTRLVTHSLRHRMVSRLRAVGAPRDVAVQIVGHDEKTVHDGYGGGYPVRVIQEWMERTAPCP